MASYNHFSYVPSSVTDDRSAFKFKKPISKAIQLGYLYPICKPIVMLPGSSLTLDIAMEIRSQPLISPLMSELVLDLFAFNIPNRIVWEHWKQFLGSVDDVLFDNLTEYTIPHFKYGINLTSAGGTKKSFDSGAENYQWNQCLACHFELPYPKASSQDGDPYQNYEWMEISALPFRGYNFIVNEFFIPEYLSNRILFSKTDAGYSGDNMDVVIDQFNHFSSINTPGPGYVNTYDRVLLGGTVMPVCRAHRSLYTSCLPKPSLETLNLLGGLTAPVSLLTGVGAVNQYEDISSGADGNVLKADAAASSGGSLAGLGIYNSNNTKWSSLVADFSQALLTVNNYRETILLQNYYDALNRAGSRYDEILANLFHVRTAMAVISIPELIVHKRFTIYRKDVVATAQTNNGSSNVKPLGSQGAYIDTVVRDNFFTKSTTEHGYIHLLMAVRPAAIMMTSGFEPDWRVLNKLDLFYEQFQGMGDVPRKKSEVAYGFSSSDDKDSVLGYQEYSAEYKWQRGSAVGWMDPHTPSFLKGYTINEDFADTSEVGLSYYYLTCFEEEISFANCLAVPDPTVAPQFICDIRLNGTIYHPMKVYNIPGMGDAL